MIKKKKNTTSQVSQQTNNHLVNINSLKDDSYSDSCLRPLGLCELGGCCDVCWYGPNGHQNKNKENSNTQK